MKFVYPAISSILKHITSSLQSYRIANRIGHLRNTRYEHVEDYYMVGSLLVEGGSVYVGIRISDGLPVALNYAAKMKEAELLLPGQEVGTPQEMGLMGLVNQNMGNPNILRLYEWIIINESYERSDRREEEKRRETNQRIPVNCLMKAPEKHQKIGVKRKMECKEQAVVLGKNLGPYSKTTPAKRLRKG
ncbi:hypothetical protein SKAU_G00030160 [Synaphobranchus kaupii]|uniref:non-specific serine/threonine protein kinase n=1 Tax=Synaphobranchus kaupii TaxID=118154 RepID=A0A9Q1GEJ0_SYNKA|nr:hypothetical protein SKAU_G00030160 [Synaphobranchus kaupii]